MKKKKILLFSCLILLCLSGDNSNWILDQSVHKEPEIPRRVTYSLMDEKEFVSHVERFAESTKDEEAFFDYFPDMIFVGPMLTDLMKKLNFDQKYEVSYVSIPIVVNGENIVVKELLLSKEGHAEGYKNFIHAVFTMIHEDSQFTIRRLKKEELDWYWTIIAFDIEDPIFMVYNKHVSLMINFFAEGMIFIEDGQGYFVNP